MLAKRWLPLPVVFVGVLVPACDSPAMAVDDSEPLAFCNIVTHPSSYAGHSIRLTAVLTVGYEGQALYDPACKTQSTWVDIDHPFKRSRKLRRLLNKDGRALVVVEGLFHAKEPYDIDPRLPEGIKNALKGTPKQYGHLGGWSSMIEISRVLSVTKVPKGTPQ
jgi:hypothetical protein